MRRPAFAAGVAVLAAAWGVAASGHGMTAHMAAHMAAVAVAAPLMALGLAGTRADPASRWPLAVAPLPMSLIELLVVWGWHLPAARAFAAGSAAGLALEQAMFLAAGLLLWSACLGTRDAGNSERRAAGIIALLLTTMHMTLLGTLITLAPRTLFGTTGFTCLGTTLSPIVDQQLGGVIMLLAGAGSYLSGGLALLFRLLRSNRPQGARQWS
ncbi:cytochrome c oxidase assembly protein [Methylobacter luteus]|uniref:cytochrome c oxidase assembly protein n=1 Tax=Methylobacter luteus TaxID=415 RepID=UPI0004071BF9|nr:cytochrome c oxidase assembly protein [Methylobacter luteus]